MDEWIVKVVQEVVDTPLYLDTINRRAHPRRAEGLTKIKKEGPTINSIMARPESMDVKFPYCSSRSPGSLLFGPSGLPRDADEREAPAAELMQTS